MPDSGYCGKNAQCCSSVCNVLLAKCEPIKTAPTNDTAMPTPPAEGEGFGFKQMAIVVIMISLFLLLSGFGVRVYKKVQEKSLVSRLEEEEEKVERAQ